jgi:hypothetical protein
MFKRYLVLNFSIKNPKVVCILRQINLSNTPKSSMCNGPTNALVSNKTLIQMSHIKTLKITPTCFDHQMIITRELFDPG